jgi:hypothetical protein
MSNNNGEVVFVVGNTYQELPQDQAALDRTGSFYKTHDWILFVDIEQGNPDIIQHVTFDLGLSFSPRSFTCSCPIQQSKGEGVVHWRFSTRQQTYGTVQAKISIVGAGGSRTEVIHNITLGRPSQSRRQVFVERQPLRPLTTLKVDPSQKFGVELELTSPPPEDGTSLEQMASNLTQRLRGRFGRITVIRDYREGRRTTNVWKMAPDSSIVCNRPSPNCTTFELVSPILSGGNGLNQASQVLDALRSTIPNLQVNKSMGFHVHVDVSGHSLEDLIKVCQNFIKYEHVMDAFLPLSRRTGSPECNQYFQSNRQAMRSAGYGTTNNQLHLALKDCQSIEELAGVMNPGPNGGRYHKLNLQNLLGRQPTVEFRQHSATTNPRKINSWVRFCIAFVNNSARLASPKPFKQDRNDSVEFSFGALFSYVIKDRALRDYFKSRVNELHNPANGEACCSGCSRGGICEARHGGAQGRKKPRNVELDYCGYAE